MGSLDLDSCIDDLLNFALPTEVTIRELCDRLKKYYCSHPNVASVKSPLTVVGDIHGHFFDLIELFKVSGFVPNTNYLFLGNYIDLGKFSVHSVALLFALKLRYPDRITLLRGNHECRRLSQIYGLYGECMRQYASANPWRNLTEAFDHLPIAALIDDSRLALHGGISSPATEYLDQIRIIPRFCEPEPKSSLFDLLWAQPSDSKSGTCRDPKTYVSTFGSDVFNRFLHANNIASLIRGHTLCLNGYQEFFGGKLVSLWGAPDFCERVGNTAAVLEIDGQRTSYNEYTAAPASLRLPFDIHGIQSFHHPLLSVDCSKERPDYL